MRNKGIFISLFLVFFIVALFLLLQTKAKNDYSLSASPTKSPEQEIYTNKQNGFRIMYPSNWTYREYEGGVGFRPLDKPDDPQYEYITLSVSPKPTNIATLPFSEYVKVAAANEIQNYQTLSSINPFTTTDGIKGYTTTWMVQPLGPPVSPSQGGGKPTESLPISYLPALQSQNSIEVFLNNQEYRDVYTQMLTTFAYTKNK
ncbi:MAG: hypothetical protein KBD46_01535 [Candidatus Levybacteria bacterium]|nr:hypothetical protein [Candidatus Levybacteria bacterium]